MMYRAPNLLIPGDFPPVVSGIATYFYEIWKFFPASENFILAPRDKEYQAFDQSHSFRIIRRAIPTANSLSAKLVKGLLYAFWALRLQRCWHWRKIHCGQVLSSGFCGWLCYKLFRIPYVIYVYGSETLRLGGNALLRKALRTFLLHAEHIVANSRFTRDEFVAFGIPVNKFSVITPGVDTMRFAPAEKDNVLVDRYQLDGKFVLLTVARLDERKGHDRVIEAVAGLSDNCPHLVYLIVGKGREEPRLRELCRKLNISAKVIFCGYVPDAELPAYYNLADVFILMNRQTTSDARLEGDYEGFGIVFLEAAACRKPVIAGNFGGIADAVADLQTGFIIDSNDVSAIQATILRFTTAPELCSKMGSAGRERTMNGFDWRQISERLRKIL